MNEVMSMDEWMDGWMHKCVPWIKSREGKERRNQIGRQGHGRITDQSNWFKTPPCFYSGQL